MVSWAAIQTTLFILGPILLPKARAFYASHRTQSPPQPLSARTRLLLNILFLSSSLALLSTISLPLPYLSPAPNIFRQTNSRLLQTPTDVLFARLRKLQAPLSDPATYTFTAEEELLRSRLASKEGRLLYAAYGPDVLTRCSWCAVDNPHSFLYYALPGIAAAHLAHVFVLGLVTSSLLSEHGHVWRASATIAAVALLLAETYLVSASPGANAHLAPGAAATFAFERARVWRGVAVAAVDAALGYMLWLSGTRRWTVGLESVIAQERLETAARALETALGKLVAAGYLKRTVLGDRALRERMGEAWRAEGADVWDCPEVKEVRERVGKRDGMEDVRREAAKRSRVLVASVPAWAARLAEEDAVQAPATGADASAG